MAPAAPGLSPLTLSAYLISAGLELFLKLISPFRDNEEIIEKLIE